VEPRLTSSNCGTKNNAGLHSHIVFKIQESVINVSKEFVRSLIEIGSGLKDIQ